MLGIKVWPEVEVFHSEYRPAATNDAWPPIPITHTFRCARGIRFDRRRKGRWCGGDWQFTTARLHDVWQQKRGDGRVAWITLGVDL
jgi:hypothetical protein